MVTDIVRSAYEKAEILTLEDGFYYYFPECGYGCLAAHHLRQLADELDRLNKPLQDQLDLYFEKERNAPNA